MMEAAAPGSLYGEALTSRLGAWCWIHAARAIIARGHKPGPIRSRAVV